MKQTIIGAFVTVVVTVVAGVALWLIEPHVKPTINMPGKGPSQTQPPKQVSGHVARQPQPLGHTQVQPHAFNSKSPPSELVMESVQKVPEATQTSLTSPQQPKPMSSQDASYSHTLDGQWFSTQFRYGFKVKGDIGIATLSNSSKFAPGDVILRLERLSEGEFQGEQMFTDGEWKRVSGSLLDADTLKMTGGGHVWTMSRR